jgi:selenide, water dikinase
MSKYKLTQFSPGAGCGCKISPKDLEEILQSDVALFKDPNLMVGNESKDDAAVFDLGNGQAVISTTDFFTPIVDDPYDFGRIAAVNAISDIYAMGGKPIMAISILGWPLEKLPKEEARKVIEGARSVCTEAGIALAGGHSIDISDPIFGLAVSGVAGTENIKQNNQAKAGNLLYLTKALGIGIITTSEKNGIVSTDHKELAVELMTTLNKAGLHFAELEYVSSMTDVTGFGLLGHLIEMAEGSNLHAQIEFKRIPVIDGLEAYIEKKSLPGGTFRNWKSYGHKVGDITKQQRAILCDPQTSGGLLIAVEASKKELFENEANALDLDLQPFGRLLSSSNESTIVSII